MNDEAKHKVISDEKTYISLDDDDNILNDIYLINTFKTSFKTLNPPPIITILDESDDEDNSPTPTPSTPNKSKVLYENPNPGLLAQPFQCDLCTVSKPKHQSIIIKGCTHFFCCECVENYFHSKLGAGLTDIGCPAPECWGTLDPEYCKDFVSREVYDRWGKQLCESVLIVDGGHKCYCPYSDCKGLMIADYGDIVRAVCPYCHRMFCAKCGVKWHEGVGCQPR